MMTREENIPDEFDVEAAWPFEEPLAGANPDTVPPSRPLVPLVAETVMTMKAAKIKPKMDDKLRTSSSSSSKFETRAGGGGSRSSIGQRLERRQHQHTSSIDATVLDDSSSDNEKDMSKQQTFRAQRRVMMDSISSSSSSSIGSGNGRREDDVEDEEASREDEKGRNLHVDSPTQTRPGAYNVVPPGRRARDDCDNDTTNNTGSNRSTGENEGDDLATGTSVTTGESTNNGSGGESYVASAQLVDIEAEETEREREIRERIRTEAVVASVVDEKEENDEQRRTKQRRKKYTVVGVLLSVILLVVVITTAVIIPRQRNQDNGSNGAVSLSTEEYLIQLFSPISGDDLFDDGKGVSANTTTATAMPSASNQAMMWMLKQNEDGVFLIEEHGPDILIERFALATLFYATNGPTHWIDDVGFLSPLSVCEWPPLNISSRSDLVNRIDCNEDSRVISVTMEGNNLNGTIPFEIGSLRFLMRLSLQADVLYGIVPYEVSQLTSLTSLSFNNNQLTGSLHDDEFWEKLRFLKFVDLSENELNSVIPAKMVGIETLEELRLYRNLLEGKFPDVPDRSALRKIIIFDNYITGSLPLSLFSLRQLESLDPADNILTGSLPTNIGNLASLAWLDLSNNHMSGELPSALGLLNQLAVLYATENNFNSTLPSALGDMVRLEELFLNGNSLFGVIPSELGRLDRSLQNLHLHHNFITGTIPSSLAQLTRLGSLQLSRNLLTGKVPTEFGRMTDLFYLSVYNNSLTGSLDDVVCDHPNLRIGAIEADCSAAAEGDGAIVLPEVNCTCCVTCCNDQTGECTEILDTKGRCLRDAEEFEEPDKFDVVTCTCEDLDEKDLSWYDWDGTTPATRLICETNYPALECPMCSQDGKVCVRIKSVGIVYLDFYRMYSYAENQYTSGRSDSIQLTYDFDDLSRCLVGINDEECNSCKVETCRDGSFGHVIDCRNVIDETTGDVATYNGCILDSGDFGVFGAFYTFESDPNAACRAGFDVFPII